MVAIVDAVVDVGEIGDAGGSVVSIGGAYRGGETVSDKTGREGIGGRTCVDGTKVDEDDDKLGVELEDGICEDATLRIEGTVQGVMRNGGHRNTNEKMQRS